MRHAVGVRQGPAWLVRRRAIRAYRFFARRCERELRNIPSSGGPGASVRRAVAWRVVQLIDQVRRIPLVSGLADDAKLKHGLAPLEARLGELREEALRV